MTYRDELCGATAIQCVDTLRTVPGDVELLLTIGHNPGLEDILQALTGATNDLPTAAIAHVRLAVLRWAGTRVDSAARLVQLWRPREAG